MYFQKLFSQFDNILTLVFECSVWCIVFITAVDNERLWADLLTGPGVCESILLVQCRYRWKAKASVCGT